MKGVAVLSSCVSPSKSLNWTPLLSQMAIIITEPKHWFSWVDNVVIHMKGINAGWQRKDNPVHQHEAVFKLGS